MTRARTSRLGCLLSLAMAWPALAVALDASGAEHALALAQDKYARAAARLAATDLPKATGTDGRWRTVSASDRIGWTQGFFAGTLWYLHEATGASAWRDRAEKFTASLEGQKTNTETHDTGFKLVPSFGNAYRLTRDAADRDVLLAGAASLATRYRASIGAIDCCDWNPDWKLPVVVDTMMNIELLLLGAKNGGDPAWAGMALDHALRTRADLVRSDGSTFHVADYDPDTGALRWRGTYQGAADGSTWSRGQAWAVYGFTMVYRYTRDARMLDAARLTADYFVAHLPPGRVPNWDFDSTLRHDDSSAGAAAASALLELATFVGGADSERYRTTALAILDALASPDYLDERTTTEGLLLHGSGHVPAGREVDVSLVYGDYYFVEALLRARPWPAAPPPGGGTDPGTPPGGGGGDPGTPPGDGGGDPGTPPGSSGGDPGTPPVGGDDPAAPGGGGGTPESPTGGGDGTDTPPVGDGGETPAPPPKRASGGCSTGGAADGVFLAIALLAPAALRRRRIAPAAHTRTQSYHPRR